MTTRAPKLALLILLLGVAACVGGAGRRGGLPEVEVQQMPEQVALSYRLFALRCSRCHTLSRPLNASITDYSHWEQYVTRMRRHAGSGISKRDADQILVFLKYYTEQKAAEADEVPQ